VGIFHEQTEDNCCEIMLICATKNEKLLFTYVPPNEAKLDLGPESGPNYITAAHAFVIATLILGLRAPLDRAQK